MVYLILFSGNWSLISVSLLQFCFATGNASLVYTIIRKRSVFHQMANLPTEHTAIAKVLTKRGKKMQTPAQVDPSGRAVEPSMEGSMPAQEAEPGTLKVSLAATPGTGSSFLECQGKHNQQLVVQLVEGLTSDKLQHFFVLFTAVFFYRYP